MLILSGCGGETAELEEGASVVTSIVDSIVSGKQSDIADNTIGQNPQEIRAYFVDTAKSYYMESGAFTEGQCEAVAGKMLSSAAQVITYRVEPISKNRSVLSYDIYFTTVDPAAFSAKYDELSTKTLTGRELSDEERAILSYDLYMEALDELTASNEEKKVPITLEHTSTWKIRDASEFLVAMFGILIGG